MSNKTLYTTLFALAAGVTIGILIAPAKGKETRARLRKAAAGAKETWDALTEERVEEIPRPVAEPDGA